MGKVLRGAVFIIHAFGKGFMNWNSTDNEDYDTYMKSMNGELFIYWHL